MTIGLIILGIAAILIFFGLAERFFRKVGISNWLAFLLVLALVVGAIVPNITIGNFSMNVGGFLVPIVLSVMFIVMIGWNSETARAILAMVAVLSVTVATKMLIMPSSTSMIVTASLIIGFVGGTVAYLIGQSRLATLFACMSGIVAGDVVASILMRFVINGTPIALGSRGIFDALIIASVFGVVLIEVITAMRRAMNRSRINRTTLNVESGEDADLEAVNIESGEDAEFILENEDINESRSYDNFDEYFDDEM